MFVCACVCIFFVRLCIYAACVSVYMCVLTWDEGAGWERRGERAGEEAESCDWSDGRQVEGDRKSTRLNSSH